MRGASMVSIAGIGGRATGAPRRWASFALLAQLHDAYARAISLEIAERRLFLWVPVCVGTGAVVHLTADRDPSLAFTVGLMTLCASLAMVCRGKPSAFRLFVASAAFFGGLSSAGFRSARVGAPVLDRLRVAKVTGFLEEVDHRREGARFILRVTSVEGLAPEAAPYRMRLTTKRAMQEEAGSHVSLRARLLPPARAAMPGGYDFARDAYFARIGAVGNVTGRIDVAEAAAPADFGLRLYAAIDRARNALARRVERAIGGPAGAIGAAMVTGKRDFLDDPTREAIREAGIFHIITIAGVQMTLVAGIFFWGFRRLLALSRTLALHYPIKKWAAALAMLGAIAYDIGTGSRVGSERALYMTLIMLGAVLFDRQAFSMRNLALAAFVIVIFEPEALLGASFQLSFAAVAALVAVWEARAATARRIRSMVEMPMRPRVDRNDKLLMFLERTRQGPLAMLVSTLCATAATASFMAAGFHELSPYVLLGNPLTLTIIEFFAVPGALIGSFLYPLGLDGWVWNYLGLGINFVLWAAKWIGALPGATAHLYAFAPWAIAFLSLALLCAVLWRSLPMRLLSLPLAMIGIYGAASGERFDVAIAPTGDAVAARMADGRLAAFGRRPGAFGVEQWLRADADGRLATDAILASAAPRTQEGVAFAEKPGGPEGPRCDLQGCAMELEDGRTLSLVLDRRAFAQDCARADIIVSPLPAPSGCAAELVIDIDRLRETGATLLRLVDSQVLPRTARSATENRPWSPAPKREVDRAPNGSPLAPPVRADDAVEEGDQEQDPPFR